MTSVMLNHGLLYVEGIESPWLNPFIKILPDVWRGHKSMLAPYII